MSAGAVETIPPDRLATMRAKSAEILRQRDEVDRAIAFLYQLVGMPAYRASEAVQLLEAEGFDADVATRAIAELNRKLDAEVEEQAAPIKRPDIYYNAGGKTFLTRAEDGAWIPQSEAQVKRLLRSYGVDTSLPRGAKVSELDQTLIEIMHRFNVSYAGPLAGYSAGVVDVAGRRVLVTESPRLIDPEPGDWTILLTVLVGLLGEEQLPYFFGWVKVATEALRAGKRIPGQALVMAGPKDCGKSLIQGLITLLLGGRAARPYDFMTGGTPFNAHLFGAEHLMVEDEVPSTDLRSRRAFGAQLKSVTVNLEQQCHAKQQTPLMLRPFWRLSVTLNDEPENLMALPPLDESIIDKVILLRARQQAMPMPTGSLDEREAFWNQLVSDLPAFLHYLATWTIPAGMRSQRFGVTHYHHPELLDALSELSPEHRLLSLIDGYLLDGGRDQWAGTSEDLERALTGSDSDCRHEASRLFTFNTAAGTYLGRLARRFPRRVQSERRHEARIWTILNSELVTA